MSATTTTATHDPAARRVPRRGGLSPTVVGLELRRMLRNRRTLFFTMFFPAALFLAIGSTTPDAEDPVGVGNVAAYVLVSMALYGASLVTASTGASVALERAQGWSRQLRLTPLNPVVHILTKAFCAVVLGCVAAAVVLAVGVVQGKAEMPAGVWVACGALAVACSLVFASLGVFVGFLVPSENAMQILGPGLALLAFLGDLFIPITEGSTLWKVAEWTPMFGVAQVSRAPLTHDLAWTAVLNVVAWLLVFSAGAAWRMGKDTARG